MTPIGCLGLPRWLISKDPPPNAGGMSLIPGLGRSSGGGSTPVFLPGESHGQRSLAGYSPRGHKESDTTEHSRTRAWDVLREHSCLIICIKPDFALLCCSTFSSLIIKDECGRVRAGLYITFIDKSSYKSVCVVNREWNNFPGSRLETPFPQHSKESLSTVTTPLFVKLINCI